MQAVNFGRASKNCQPYYYQKGRKEGLSNHLITKPVVVTSQVSRQTGVFSPKKHWLYRDQRQQQQHLTVMAGSSSPSWPMSYRRTIQPEQAIRSGKDDERDDAYATDEHVVTVGWQQEPRKEHQHHSHDATITIIQATNNDTSPSEISARNAIQNDVMPRSLDVAALGGAWYHRDATSWRVSNSRTTGRRYENHGRAFRNIVSATNYNRNSHAANENTTRERMGRVLIHTNIGGGAYNHALPKSSNHIQNYVPSSVSSSWTHRYQGTVGQANHQLPPQRAHFSANTSVSAPGVSQAPRQSYPTKIAVSNNVYSPSSNSNSSNTSMKENSHDVAPSNTSNSEKYVMDHESTIDIAKRGEKRQQSEAGISNTLTPSSTSTDPVALQEQKQRYDLSAPAKRIKLTSDPLSGRFDKLDLLCSATIDMGPLQENPSGCSCPKSRCIALYCDCFKAGRRCNPGTCTCLNCKNTISESGPDGARSKAILTILARNPRAFTTAGMGKDMTRQQLQPGQIACNCIRSRCLKLYCGCFQAGKFCDPSVCTCISCLNKKDDIGGHRKAAIQNCLEKRPNAFKVKKEREIGIGCACKNNRCIRKYCECFRTDVACSDKCSCRECENHTSGENHASVES